MKRRIQTKQFKNETNMPDLVKSLINVQDDGCHVFPFVHVDADAVDKVDQLLSCGKVVSELSLLMSDFIS